MANHDIEDRLAELAAHCERARAEREMPPKRQPGRDTKPVPEVDWAEVIRASLAGERAMQREYLHDYVRAMLVEMTVELRAEADAKIAAALEAYTQKMAVTRLAESVDQLRAELKQRALDTLGAVVELPNPLPSKQIN